jgi:hypothetical protein
MIFLRCRVLFLWVVPVIPHRNTQVTSDDFLERRDFMNAIKYGSNVVAPTDTKDDHGYFVFRYIWRPLGPVELQLPRFSIRG